MPTPLNIRQRTQDTGGNTPTLSSTADIRVQGGAQSTAGRVAQDLLSAIGIGAEELGRRKAEGAAELATAMKDLGTQDYRQGMSDYTSGTYNDTLASQSSDYLQAHADMFTKAQLAMDTDELTKGADQFIASHDLAGLNDYLNKERDARWAGVDGTNADLVNEHYLKLHTVLSSAAQKQAQIDTSAQDNASMTVSALGNYTMAHAEGKPYDFYGDLNDQTLKMFGSNANDALYSTLKTMIATTHDPSIIDNMPDKLPNGAATLKTHPQYRDAVAALRTDAANYKTQAVTDQLAVAQKDDMLKLEDDIKSGAYPTEARLDAVGNKWGWDSAKRLSWSNKVRDAKDAANEAAIDIAKSDMAFTAGNGWSLLGAKSKGDVSAAFDDYIGRRLQYVNPEQRMEFILNESAKNGMVFSTLANKLTHPNLSDPAAFTEDLKLFTQIKNSQYANVISSYIPDDSTRVMYESAMVLNSVGKSVQTQLEAVKNLKEKDKAEAWATSKVRVEALKLLDKVDLESGAIKGVSNPELARQRAYSLVETYGKTGLLTTASDIIKAVSSDMKTNSVVIGDKYFPRTADMPADASKVFDHYQSATLPALLGDRAKTDDVQLLPDGRGYGVYYKGTIEPVLDAQGHPIRPTLRDMTTTYQQYLAFKPVADTRSIWDKEISRLSGDTPMATTGDAPSADPASPSLSFDNYFTDRPRLTKEQQAKLDPAYKSLGQTALKATQSKLESAKKTAAVQPDASISSWHKENKKNWDNRVSTLQANVDRISTFLSQMK